MDYKTIALSGSDGSGKSTLASGFKALLDKNHLQSKIVSISDTLKEMGAVNFDVQAYLSKLNPRSRILFFFHAMHHAVSQENDLDFLIVDGYWHKYLASEVALGLDLKEGLALAKVFPVPDLHIYLDIEPELAASRKNNFTAYECGFKQTKLNHFISHQRKLKKTWQQISKDDWLVLDASKETHDLDSILNMVLGANNS